MSEESQNGANDNIASLECTASAGAECNSYSIDSANNTSSSPCGQMTASCTPSLGESSKWICEMCTYENFPLSKKCTMCRSNKPSLGEDIFKLQDGASALPPSNDICGAEAVTEKLKPLRISSPHSQSQASASCGVKWSCPTCTYENWPRSVKCAMCGHNNPAQSPVESMTKMRTNVGINDIVNSQNGPIHDIDTTNRRSKRRNIDWLWLQACLGVVQGDVSCVSAYLSAGGDVARALTEREARLLDRASAFDPGHTLVHLAIRFQRQDILSTLLSRISGGGPGLKRSPSYIAPDLASAIRRHMASCIRYKKGNFQCRYINEFCTFVLPAEIEELPSVIQDQLFNELLDQEAQRNLEVERKINYSIEITLSLGSRLYALWNRSAGDCLLDAVCQSAYGVFDRDGTLRAALADSLTHAQRSLFERWSSWELMQARLLSFLPEEKQLSSEWANALDQAHRPRAPLQQIHVFTLAHIMRRPIIVYGVDVVNSFRGEALGYASFHGIYLPLLWEAEFCSKSPLCLGYTRGHFSALVPLESYSRGSAYISREEQQEGEDVTFLPLTDVDGKLMPVHFLNCEEMADSEAVVRRFTCVKSLSNTLVAIQRIRKRPLLTAQMLEEWLNHYRRLVQQTRGPFPPRLQTADFSSDPETDED